MDADLNKYDLYHRVTHHSRMSDADWDDAYRAAWESFYSFDHIRTILRRAAASPNGRPQTTLTTLLWFKLMTMFEGVHPLEGGAFRRKVRRQRRYGLTRETPLRYSTPERWRTSLSRPADICRFIADARKILKEALAAPDRWTYTDIATSRPGSRRIRQSEPLPPDKGRRGRSHTQTPRRPAARPGRLRQSSIELEAVTVFGIIEPPNAELVARGLWCGVRGPGGTDPSSISS